MLHLTNSFKVVAVNKKTQAVFFKDLKVGDIFTLSYYFDGHYNGSPIIKLIKGDKVHWNKATQLKSNLDNFELEAV